MSNDITEQLIKILENKSFALQLDEGTDISKKAQILIYIKFIKDNQLHQEFLDCIELKTTTKSSDIYRAVHTVLNKFKLNWKDCIQVEHRL